MAQIQVRTVPGLPDRASFDLSPDGQEIVYSSDHGLWIRATSGGAARKLAGVEKDGDPIQPQWSPDGKSIAVLYSSSMNDSRLYLIPATGGTPRFIANLCIRGGTGFSWLPNGRQLILPLPRSDEDPEPPCRLTLFDAAAGQPRRFLTMGNSPAISPDGKRMAFVRERKLLLYPLSPETGIRETVVTEHLRAIGQPIWTRDGSSIVYRIWGECPTAFRVQARPGAVPVEIKGIPDHLEIDDATTYAATVIATDSATLNWPTVMV